ncbi:DUF5984 family protein [Kribbella sp. NPDC005582]|uniref:DUF5984 family protein n=1 Tax=Kribbella sp. NPDC005582 TaxID=3156893 RepID=UPI0033BDF470
MDDLSTPAHAADISRSKSQSGLEMPIRFRFGLHPLAKVGLWGGDKPTLHWFGLTDGWYWIELGDVRLLRFAADYDIPYVDYYVVRLWEDLLTLLPAALEEVPPDLIDFLESDGREWCDVESEAAEAAIDCWSDRSLNFSYLRESPSLRCWRNGDDITIDWNAPANFAEPRTLRTTVTVTDFVTAIDELHTALMAAMETRITEVEASPRPGVDLDLPNLHREQQDRAQWLTRARSRIRTTDWTAVRTGATQLQPRR